MAIANVNVKPCRILLLSLASAPVLQAEALSRHLRPLAATAGGLNCGGVFYSDSPSPRRVGSPIAAAPFVFRWFVLLAACCGPCACVVLSSVWLCLLVAIGHWQFTCLLCIKPNTTRLLHCGLYFELCPASRPVSAFEGRQGPLPLPLHRPGKY